MNTTTTTIMLLIDADNVSIDVMEQAVALMLEQHGALHVRRAYGTAESALKHQAVFKRLGIRPIVNLATGKNSTDIALAVDAIDLVHAERPALVAIASSDSDFAPLVARLREKGCRVVGIGQAGKTGDETRTVYDAFTVLEHRSKGGSAARTASAPPPPGPRPAARSRRTTAVADDDAAGADKEAAAPVRARRGRGSSAAARSGTASAAPATAPAPVARKTSRRRAAAAPKPAAAPAAGPAAAAAPAARATSGDAALAERVGRILQAMPELERGQTVELRVAADRLREAGLLSRSGSSTRVLGAHPDRFELLPTTQPNRVRLKA
ncbi:MAG: NYN domain-containing protein [Rubrivivax sp.]